MLEILELSVSYGPRPVLHKVSLAVPRGEMVALIGPNGAGKSTLLRAVSGVLRPQSGRVLVDGHDLAAFSPARRAAALAVVPQARRLPDGFTVRQVVLLSSGT